MGIPKFFVWLAHQCPQMIIPLSGDSIAYVDNLYLDMNGIIHQCKQGNKGENEIITAVLNYVEEMVSIARPAKRLFLAVDGVPPRAKMTQQRQRRFQSLAKKPKSSPNKEDNNKKEEMESSKPIDETGKMEENENETSIEDDLESSEDEAEDFDSQNVTPGTAFMVRLSDHFKFFIQSKMQNDRFWKKCKVYFSGVEVPGEGEHKIMDFIRRLQRDKENYNPDEVHCMYGMDADLIMLGLSTHEKKFLVLREKVDIYRGGGSRRRRNNMQIRRPQEVFHLLDFGILRKFVGEKFSDLKGQLKFAYESERLIDDFVLMLFLCGNDFLPSLPTLSIAEGALNYFFTIYKNILPEMGGYITSTNPCTIHFGRLKMFLKSLAEIEIGVLDNRLYTLKKKYGDLMKLVQYNQLKETGLDTIATSLASSVTIESPPSAPSAPIEQNMEEEDELVEEEMKVIDNKFINLFHSINFGQSELLNAKANHCPLQDIFQGKPDSVIESDADEQLLLKIHFSEKVKLSHISIEGIDDFAPSKVKLFVNKPNMEFSDVDSTSPTLQLQLSKMEGKDSLIPLDFVKFQNISVLGIFIESNIGGKEATKLTKMSLFGVPIAGLDMKKLKKIPRWQKHKKQKKQGNNSNPNQKPTNSNVSVSKSPFPAHRLKQVEGLTLFQSIQIKTNPEMESKMEIDFDKWRKLFYTQKLEFPESEISHRLPNLVRKYVEGLVWIFKYYYEGCPSWSWFYPFHYAPLASDLIQDQYKPSYENIVFDIGKPISPLYHMLCTLPAHSSHLVPAPMRHLMGENSPLKELFPSEVKVDGEGKQNSWEYTVLVPFMDFERMLEEVNKVDLTKLTELEKARNEVGTPYLFEFKEDIQPYHLFSTLKSFPDVMECTVLVTPYI